MVFRIRNEASLGCQDESETWLGKKFCFIHGTYSGNKHIRVNCGAILAGETHVIVPDPDRLYNYSTRTIVGKH